MDEIRGRKALRWVWDIFSLLMTVLIITHLFSRHQQLASSVLPTRWLYSIKSGELQPS